MRNILTVLALVLLTIATGACGESLAGGSAGDVASASTIGGQRPDAEALPGATDGADLVAETEPDTEDDSAPEEESAGVIEADESVDESADQSAAADAAPWRPKTIDELVDPVFVVDVGFGFGVPSDWYEQVWMKPGDGQGEVVGGEGVRFTGRGGSTRSGIMTDVGFDVGDYPHLVLAVHGAVLEQGLAGTGWHGREAPLAVLVTYVDVEGTQHVGLGEDPASPTNMFFRGFTAIPEQGMLNGVVVEFGEPFVYQFDLMELDPAPVQILAVGIEGAGWDPRVGEAYEFILAAGF